MIITIGSGNIEIVLDVDGDLRLGRKHIAKGAEFFGGSCLNYSLRLMSVGRPVYPIPLLGKDRDGRFIQKQLCDVVRQNNISSDCLDFIESDEFLSPSIKTPKSTIVVHQGQRTTFSQGLTQTEALSTHIEKRIQFLKEHVVEPGSIMIGHLSPDGGNSDPGKLTKMIVNTFCNKNLVFANFGKGQLVHGIEFWKECLSQIDVLQLNLDEIRFFFKQSGMDYSLSNILTWLSEHSITAVITLNRFGAIATYKEGQNGVIFAMPIDTPEIVDPTGAGDAFAAGMIFRLNGNKNFTYKDYTKAIGEGRLWASFACRNLGACTACPDLNTVETQKTKQAHSDQSKFIELTKNSNLANIIDLIEKAY